MLFSKRFALLILLGVVPVIWGLFIGEAFIFFLLYNVILLILFIWDILMTPGPKLLEVSRICEEKFSLGADNEVILKVRNNGRYRLKLELKDDVPPYFEVREHTVRIEVLPHSENEGRYLAMPKKRGKFAFGKVYLRYPGVMGLCSRYGRFDLEKSYKVYPNIKNLRRYTLAALKKSQLMQGAKKVRTFGLGTEFESLREYNEGDDYRKINWLATARTDKIIVNAYEPERNQQLFVMLDISRVMNSEINYIKKLDYSVNSSFLLADFAIRKGDNVGLLVFDNEVRRFIKPGKGMAHFQLIAENLYDVQENFVTADYRGALLYLNQNQKRRSLLCIFTEIFNSDEAACLISVLKSVARNHIPLVITIKDHRLEESINADVKELDDVFFKAAAIKLVEQREKIRKLFSGSGIACIDVPPDKLSIEVLNRYLQMKQMMQI